MKTRPEIKNKKAYHDYFIDEMLECGISLRGNEVKSLAEGKGNINEAWVSIQDGNLVIRNMFISKYETANAYDVDERRERQLLAHKKEIRKIAGQVAEKGVTIVPLKIYFVKSKCKVLIGIGRGKHNYDKRNDLKNKQVKRDIEREMKTSR
jgi:SsrA-binding protein